MEMKTGKEQRKKQQNKVQSDAYLKEHLTGMLPSLSEEACQKMILDLKSEPQKSKKRFLKIFYSRILFTGIIFLIQVIWFAIMLTLLSRYTQWITIVFRIFSVGMGLFLLNKNENSVYKISWVLIISSLPVLGGLMYLLFGNKHPSRRIHWKIQREQMRLLPELTERKETEEELSLGDHAGIACCLSRNSGYPVYRNTQTKYYPLGEDMFRDMLQDLAEAKQFIFLEYFIISEGVMWKQILSVLEEKAREGVDVRIIYDDVGCLTTLPFHYIAKLEKMGISCMAFNPFRPLFSLAVNNRDHRKILVIDGHTAYTGGINLADEYINLVEKYGHWKDTAVRVQGEAALAFLEMFLEMWDAFSAKKDKLSDFVPEITWKPVTAAGYVQPFYDSPLDEKPTGENLYLNIINQAKKYVYLTTPYLIISDEMQRALVLAAGRGVDVRIITPGVPDKAIVYRITRSNYHDLLKGGVRIFEYVPGFIHAKNFVSDDEIAVVGTVNMDFRSLYLHFECGAVLYQTGTVADVKADFEETLFSAREVHLEDMRRGFFSGILDALLRLLSPLV